MDGSGVGSSVGHPQQSQMGVVAMASPGIPGVLPQIPPALQQQALPPQTIQHHGPPPTPTFSTMMPHSSQTQGPRNAKRFSPLNS